VSAFGEFTATALDGSPLPLKSFSGKPVLVVNVASQCGLTPQYAGLEKLHQELGGKGLVVLGLPCNQFGAQEPGTEKEIATFCETKFGVSFPMTAKIDVNGPRRHPLYAWLTAATGGADIGWNFEKFLVGRDGTTVQRFSPKVTPEDPALRAAIAKALAAS
jgi:glutathione peroxidase